MTRALAPLIVVVTLALALLIACVVVGVRSATYGQHHGQFAPPVEEAPVPARPVQAAFPEQGWRETLDTALIPSYVRVIPVPPLDALLAMFDSDMRELTARLERA